MWLLPSSLLGMAYQSNLLAKLVKVTVEQPIDTYQDMIDRDVTMFMLDGTSHHYWTESPSPMVRKAFQKGHLDKPNSAFMWGPNADDHAFESISDGKGVIAVRLIEGKDNGQRGVLRGYSNCMFGILAREAPIVITTCGYYWAMNHPLQERGDRIFLAFRESGMLLHRVNAKDNLRLDNPDCDDDSFMDSNSLSETWKKIDMGHSQAIFIFIGAGLVISVMVYIGEKFFNIKHL